MVREVIQLTVIMTWKLRKSTKMSHACTILISTKEIHQTKHYEEWTEDMGSL